MLTIDASVFVAAEITSEPHNKVARRFLAEAIPSREPIHLPWLAVVETAVSIGRRLDDPSAVETIADKLSAIPRATYHVLDGALASAAVRIGAAAGLRGADAVYAAVAEQTGSVLVTYDGEMLTRLTGRIEVCTPDTWLKKER